MPTAVGEGIVSGGDGTEQNTKPPPLSVAVREAELSRTSLPQRAAGDNVQDDLSRSGGPTKIESAGKHAAQEDGCCSATSSWIAISTAERCLDAIKMR